MKALDLFAGPGGWDEGIKPLGIEPLGIELDDAACATRKAAGHPTLQGDVAALDPADFAPVDLLIASPPCQAWSMAGKRGGEADKGLVYELTDHIAQGREIVNPVTGWEDERSRLVTEPIRWALALRPRFIALEQVPPVLDYWKHIANILRDEGYSVWAGILEAERYGVPQTRERAILMASRDGLVHPPAPTHQRYVPGEPARHDVTLEGEILPWVSMAETLGWTGTLRTGDNTMKHSRDPQDMVPYERPVDVPAPTVDTKGTWKHGEEHTDPPMRWKTRVGFPRNDDQGGEGYRERDFRDQDEPAFTVTEKARSAIKMRANAQANACERDADEPAPTITGGNDTGDRKWLKAGTGEKEAVRSADEPAPTMRFGARLNTVAWTDGEPPEHLSDPGWEENRPATTLAGDARIFPPDGHKANDGRDNSRMVGRPENAVRVTVEEASILQGFRSDYPWQGSRTKQFQQVGNAVPPPLARAIIAELLTGAVELREAA